MQSALKDANRGVKSSAPRSYSRTVVVLTQIIPPVSFVVSISDASGVAPGINSVEFLLKIITFERLKLEKPRPDINIIQKTKDRGKTYKITFSRAWYEKNVHLHKEKRCVLFPMSTFSSKCVNMTRGYMDHECMYICI